MPEILIVTQVACRVERTQDHHIDIRSDQPLHLGEYDIYCNGDIHVNDEPWVARTITINNSTRDAGFQEAIRNRDGGRCVFSGLINKGARSGQWYGFQAAHIVPLSAENMWELNNFGKWIMDGINSVQNGFLMQTSFHSMWDNYIMSVNPDVNFCFWYATIIFNRLKDKYEIVVFQPDSFNVDGRTLDLICRDPQDSRHVSDELLRWHYRQYVFANMRGMGELVFEHDYPPGSDIMGELREAPLGREQFELMSADRLRGFATE